jgi:hypothetical protein
MTQPATLTPAQTTAPALTLAEQAYEFLGGFRRHTVVTVTGRGFTVTGEISTPLQDRGPRARGCGGDRNLRWAYLVVTSRTATVMVTVNDLLRGHKVIAALADADAGRWQPFHPAAREIMADPDPAMAGWWAKGLRDGTADPAGLPSWTPDCRTGALYRAYSEGFALAAAPDLDLDDLITAIRAAHAGGWEDEA